MIVEGLNWSNIELKMNLQQFSIVSLDLDPTVGHEQSGIRPCLVIQTNAGIGKMPTLLVIPFTSQVKKVYSFEVVVSPSETNGLRQDSKLLIGHTKAVDRSRVKKVLGVLDSVYYAQVFQSLDFIVDRNQQFN